MQKLKNKLHELEFKIYSGLYNLMKKEDGDTNFISIAIVLVIVLAVAIIFIGFKDEIMGVVEDKMEEFMNIFENQ